MPSPTVNVPIFTVTPAGEEFWDFSDFNDNINLQNFGSIGNTPVRMFAGADIVLLSSILRGGYDNIVGGNLGSDTITAQAGDQTRAQLKGGADGDTLNLIASINGGDWIQGGGGNDIVQGGNVGGGAFNALFGGVGADLVRGGAGRDVVTGGPDKDSLRGNANSDIFLFSTANFNAPWGETYVNAPTNSIAVDVVEDFGPTDFISIAGVSSFGDLDFVASGGNTLISSDNIAGLSGQRFIALVLGVAPGVLQASGRVLVGGEAIFAQVQPDAFENDPVIEII
jgi:hypothetical protein